MLLPDLENGAMRRVADRALRLAALRLENEAAQTADHGYRVAAQEGLRVLEEMRREMLYDTGTELH